MTDPISWKAIATLATTGNTIIDSKKRSELIKQFNLLIRKKRKIIVFGLSGAGKSQFINCLKKNLVIADRTDATVKIKFKLEDFPIHFIDTPGQAARQFPRKQEVINILKDGVEGIINVVSYGYEENPDHALDNIFDTQGNVKQSFLKLNRKAEIERLAEWLPLIQPTDVNWIINIVSKADLWWEEVENVNSHYLTGEYSEAFSVINNYTNVITMPFCSIIKPYYDTKTSGRIGEIHKEKMHNHFINQLLHLLNTEK